MSTENRHLHEALTHPTEGLFGPYTELFFGTAVNTPHSKIGNNDHTPVSLPLGESSPHYHFTVPAEPLKIHFLGQIDTADRREEYITVGIHFPDRHDELVHLMIYDFDNRPVNLADRGKLWFKRVTEFVVQAICNAYRNVSCRVAYVEFHFTDVEQLLQGKSSVGTDEPRSVLLSTRFHVKDQRTTGGFFWDSDVFDCPKMEAEAQRWYESLPAHRQEFFADQIVMSWMPFQFEEIPGPPYLRGFRQYWSFKDGAHIRYFGVRPTFVPTTLHTAPPALKRSMAKYFAAHLEKIGIHPADGVYHIHYSTTPVVGSDVVTDEFTFDFHKKVKAESDV